MGWFTKKKKRGNYRRGTAGSADTGNCCRSRRSGDRERDI